jgi:hypothetical protein
MFTSDTDDQKIILEFLEPQEIKALYETCKDSKVMFEEITKHTNYIVDCKRIISDKEIKWFELKNIKLKLLETYKNIYGVKYWKKNNLIHRDNDLPAIIHSDGTQIWYQNGLKHRDNDLPAIIYSDGSQCWYQNDLLHRDNDLPAGLLNGDQFWFQNGLRHRNNDLPAIIYANGDKYWYQNERLHRDNGQPAIILANGNLCWYKNDEKYIPN